MNTVAKMPRTDTKDRAKANASADTASDERYLVPVGTLDPSRAATFAYEITGLKAGVYEVYGVGDDNHDGIFDSQLESLGAYTIARAYLRDLETLQAAIRTRIREHTSPHHVPRVIVAVTDIPRTISGKITELAVREVIHGRPVKNVDALANPAALDLFRDLPVLRH
jgi:hypothetical protein